MGINFDGVNPEIKAKFDEIIKDGEISEKEFKSLSVEEQEMLEAGLAGKVKDGAFDSFKRPAAESAEKKSEGRSFGKTLGIGAVVTAASAALGGIIGGIVGFFGGGGVGAVPGAVAGAKIGAGLGAALFGASTLTSCTEEPDVPSIKIDIEDNSKTEVNIKLAINITPNSSDAEILAELQRIRQENADYARRQEEYNKAFLEALVNCGVSLDRIYELLEGMQMDVSVLVNTVNDLKGIADDTKAKLNDILKQIELGNTIGLENHKVLRAILAQITQLNGKVDGLNGKADDIRALLNKILDKVTANNEMTAVQSKLLVMILEKMDKMDAHMKAGFTAVIDKLDSMDADLVASLTTIIEKLDTLDENDKKTAGYLTQILAKMDKMDANLVASLTTIIEKLDTLDENDKKTASILTQILAKMNKMDAATQASIKVIIAKLEANNSYDKAIVDKLDDILKKLDNMDENQGKFFAMVLENFEKMDAAQQQSLQKILDAIGKNTAAINKNTSVAEKTYKVVNNILAKLDELKGKSDVDLTAILDAIANISIGEPGTVDLSNVERLLEDLLKSSQDNNKVLTSIDEKLDVVSFTLEGLKLAIDQNHSEVIAKLDAILEKIPNGCHCDISVVIQKLDELIEAVKTSPEDASKHEGILDDLDKYFD